MSYCVGMVPGFKVTAFTEALCAEIQYAFETPGQRLILEAPPRHGKTFITSQLAPAWYMGKNPSNKIITASHTATLAEDNGAKVRDYINDPLHGEVFSHKGSLNLKKQASGNFRTNGGGEFFAVGVGGTPIGKGAHVIVIDDPIRSRKDVESVDLREGLVSWYSSSIRNRLEGKGSIILMHQRWHKMDLAGYLLQEQPGTWRRITFPAFIEDTEDYMADYLRRDYGEVLVPELFDKEDLMSLRQDMNARDWYSMYQQRPFTQLDDSFDKDALLTYEIHPVNAASGMNTYILVDPATSKKKNSDFTAIAVVGLGADKNFYLLDLVVDKLSLKERAETLIRLHQKWNPVAVGYEQYAAMSDIEHIKFQQDLINYRFPISKLNDKLKKEERIVRMVPDMTEARWYAPTHIMHHDFEGNFIDTLKILKDQMDDFPQAQNDDALDVVSRIYDMELQWPQYTTGVSVAQSSEGKRSPW